MIRRQFSAQALQISPGLCRGAEQSGTGCGDPTVVVASAPVSGAINVCNEKAEQRTCHSNFPFTTQTGTTCCASNLRPAVWRSSSVDQARVGKKLSDGHSFVSDICSQHVRTAYVVPLLPPTYHARAVPTPDRQRPSRAQGRWRDAVRTCHEVPRAPRRLSLSYSHFWRAQQCAQSF